MYRLAAAILLAAGVAVAGCGGGGGGGGSSAPSALSYPPAPPYLVNQPITPLMPKVAGTVSSYSVSPALPTGLSLNPTTGEISGTPSAVISESQYTVTATNAAGATTAGVLIIVTAGSTSLYPSPFYAFTVGEGGVDYVAAAPTIYGGFPISQAAVPNVTWAVSPALPAGLTFSKADGSISGIPNTGASAANYTVTATNAAGSYSTTLTIAVSAGPALNLGQSYLVNLYGFNGSQLLSRDSNAKWVLWDYATGSAIASGISQCAAQDQCTSPLGLISLAGPTAVIGTTNGFQILAAMDGHELSTVTLADPGAVYWYKVAQDGSYVVAGTNTALTVWSTAGKVLVSRSGNYSQAIVSAAPGVVEVGQGPAGAHVIELIAVATGTSTVSAQFPGQFEAWFGDGTRFVTASLPFVSVYTTAGMQLGQVTVPGVPNLYGGYGNWLWTFGGATLTIYAVGNNSTPAATYAGGPLVASGSTVGLFVGINTETPNTINVVDLSGAAPASTTYTTPIGSLVSYVATSASTWLVGNTNGVLLDGVGLPAQPRYLTYGNATAIVGSPERFAVATSSGRIVYFDAATLALEGTIELANDGTINPATPTLLISTDGTVLAAAVAGQNSVNIYSLPDGKLVQSIAGGLLDMASLGSTPVLAVSVTGNPNCDTELAPALGGAPIWCQTLGSYQRLRLSPDGTHVAVAQAPGVGSTTRIFQNTQLVATVPGWGVGWLDNNQLLVNLYVAGTGINVGSAVFYDCSIYDAMGSFVSLPPLPEIEDFQLVSPTSVYVNGTNTVVAPSTGATLWASGSPGLGQPLGAVAGAYVIFNGGYSSILAEPLP
jgi:hypothetical protein